MPTVLVSAALILIVGAIVFGWIRNKKNGKGSCCSSCAGCSMAELCHKKKKDTE